MRVTYFLLLVTAFAFLAAFQPAVEAAPQDVATAEVAAPEARQEGSDGKPEGAADGPTSDGGKKGHGKGGKGSKLCEKGAKGKGQANKENGAKGHANKGKEQGKGKN